MLLSHEIDIQIQTKKWLEVGVNWAESCSRIVIAVLENQWVGSVPAEISVVLSEDVFVKQLNLKYRGINKPTNVLSFPTYDPVTDCATLHHLGDVVLAYETCRGEIKEGSNRVSSFTSHISHLIVHGVLHLLGFDHRKDEDAKKMEKLEIEILQSLGIDNPYA
ncbi:MAG: rRNA maturation RNase YbeY [Pseudomonadota bacterium]|nr:rRNA maturation RNase YbeY [Pseudomonadota bacterium]